MKNNKIKIDINIDFNLEWDGKTSLKQIKKDIEELIKLNVTHINFKVTKDRWDDDLYMHFNPIINRLENNEEYEKRIAEEKRIEENCRQVNLAKFEALKKKLNL